MGHPKVAAHREMHLELPLAVRAKMGSAAGKQYPSNRSSAAAAGFAGAEVDAVFKLKESAGAVCVDII